MAHWVIRHTDVPGSEWYGGILKPGDVPLWTRDPAKAAFFGWAAALETVKFLRARSYKVRLRKVE